VIRRGVIKVLYLIEEGNGERLSATGDASSQHEDNAELADGVHKGEDSGRENRALNQRKGDGAEDAARGCAQGLRGFEIARIDAAETSDDRLDGKGKAVEHGADDEAREGEGQRMAKDADDRTPYGSEWTETNKKIEAEYRRREDDGEGNDGFDDEAQLAVAQGEPACKRQREKHQHEGGDGGQPKCEEEGFLIHFASVAAGRWFSLLSPETDGLPFGDGSSTNEGCALGKRYIVSGLGFLMDLVCALRATPPFSHEAAKEWGTGAVFT
jgi:hypothetical protein